MRFTGQPRQDLTEDAESDVWQALLQSPPKGRFEPWCYAVLRNRQLDHLRHEQAERRHADAVARQRPEAAEMGPVLESITECPGGLYPQDLEAIAGWPLRHRLPLLCLSGLWAKVPPADWQRWVDEHRRSFGVPADGPFPPDVLQECDDIPRRNELLAVALNVRRNTLSVWLHRGKPRLLGLRCVRDLLPTPSDEPQP
jgi:hypothetical protein